MNRILMATALAAFAAAAILWYWLGRGDSYDYEAGFEHIPEPTVEAPTRLSGFAGKLRADAEAVIGEPRYCELSLYSERCRYTQGVEVVYIDGRADWITVSFPYGRYPLAPEGLQYLGLPVSAPQARDVNRLRWTEMSGLRELQLVGDENGVRFARMKVDRDGARVSEAATQRLAAERPAIRYAQVAAWRGPTQPELRVRFNQPVTAASVAAALELGEAVAAGPDPFDAQTPFYTPEGEARTLWRVWPQTPLEADRRYTLQVGDGLVSALGAERGLAEDPGFAVHTFPPPRYLGIQCTVGDGARLFAPDEPVHGCEPLDGIALLFNVPPDVDALRERLQLMPPPLQTEDAALDPWAVYDETPPLAGNHSPGQVYPLRLPFALAAETEYSLRVDGGLRDRFERPLAAAIDVTVATGVPSPRLVVERRRDTAGDFGRAGN